MATFPSQLPLPQYEHRFGAKDKENVVHFMVMSCCDRSSNGSLGGYLVRRSAPVSNAWMRTGALPTRRGHCAAWRIARRWMSGRVKSEPWRNSVFCNIEMLTLSRPSGEGRDRSACPGQRCMSWVPASVGTTFDWASIAPAGRLCSV